MIEVNFVKYQATGNDFIVVAANDLGLEKSGVSVPRQRWLAAFARSVLARHTGVGADGLFLVWRARRSRSEARVRIFNADGSEAEISGNGVRCAAAWLLDRDAEGTDLILETS